MQGNPLTHSSSYKRKFSLLSHQAAKDLIDKNSNNLKLIQTLNQELQNEIKKRTDLEKQLELWKKRLVEREVELRGIISKIGGDREDSHANTSNRNKIPSFISNLHSQIGQKIEENSHQTMKWLHNKQKLNIDYMDRKLDALRKEMEEKINQQKSLTLDNLKSIMQEIEDVRLMAVSIDNQNQKLLNEVKQLKIRNKILAEERKIAISENVVNNLKMKEMTKAAESRPSKRPSTESKRFRSERNSMNNSLMFSQEINTSNNYNRFLGEPVFDSPKAKKPKPFKTTESPQVVRTKERQHKSILSLQRSLKREKKRNYQMYTLFAESSQKNNQLNQILWESIDQAKREAEEPGNTFHTCVLNNLMKTEEVIKNIEKIRQTDRVPIRSKQATIDLSDLPELD